MIRLRETSRKEEQDLKGSLNRIMLCVLEIERLLDTLLSVP